MLVAYLRTDFRTPDMTETGKERQPIWVHNQAGYHQGHLQLSLTRNSGTMESMCLRLSHLRDKGAKVFAHPLLRA